VAKYKTEFLELTRDLSGMNEVAASVVTAAQDLQIAWAYQVPVGHKLTFMPQKDKFAVYMKTVAQGSPQAPVATIQGGAGNVEVGTHSYKVTFLDVAGSETAPSAKSNVITVANAADKVDITQIPIGPPGTTSRRLYRTVAGDAGNWLLLTTIADNTTVAYVDNIADGDLGDAAPAAAVEAEAVAGCLIEIVKADASRRAAQWLLNPVRYAQVKEFQDLDKKAVLDILDSVEINEGEWVAIRVNVKGTLAIAGSSYFSLTCTRTRKTL